MRAMRRATRVGYTLIELLVVLAIIAVASAIVLPALLRPRPTDAPIQTVIESARALAAARGEILYLRIEPAGTWRLEGSASPLETEGATGRVPSLASAPVTIIVSPSGSCAFDVRSAEAARALLLEPLACTLTPRLRPTSS